MAKGSSASEEQEAQGFWGKAFQATLAWIKNRQSFTIIVIPDFFLPPGMTASPRYGPGEPDA